MAREVTDPTSTPKQQFEANDVFVADRKVTLDQRIRECLEHRIPALLVGGPGLGKSARVRQAAAAMQAEHVDVRLSLYDAVDVKGLPFIDRAAVEKGLMDQTVKWATPDFVARTKSGKPTVLCYEELNCANVSTMNTALQFILDRRVGDHTLGDHVMQIACVNAAEHRAHVNPMSAPLINRFLVIEVEPSLPEFLAYAVDHQVHDAITAYLSYRPEALYVETRKVDGEFQNFPSPRSWAERVDPLLKKGIADDKYLKGCIGQGAAIEFSTFLRDRNDMPNIDKLLAGKLKIPTDWDPKAKGTKLSVIYAVTTAMAERCVRDTNKIDGAGAVLLHIQPEIASLFMAMMMRSRAADVSRKLISSGTIRQWMKNHQQLINNVIRG